MQTVILLILNKIAMKKIYTNKLMAGIIIVTVLFLLPSCAQKVTFLNSSVVPAAQGNVKVNQDENDNYNIQLKIKDLADINQLDSSKKTYVVWMETQQGRTENLGQLKSSSSLFSQQKTASLETVSSFKPVRIFVTAENGINVRYPSRDVVLATETFR